MNTLTGKSVGIALLLAAALLAALFAMGVFAPAGVGAAVEGGADAPKVSPTTIKPGTMDATFTLTFQVDDEINDPADTPDDEVTIVFPAGLALPASPADSTDFISVKQGSVTVGSVERSGQTITIGAADENGTNLQANTNTTVTITGVDVGTAGGNVTITQGTQTAINLAVTVAASVTSASARLDNVAAGAEGVTLTLTFRADTHSTAAEADDPADGIQVDEVTDGVTISLPIEYDLIGDGAYTVVGCDDRLTTCDEENDTGTADEPTITASGASGVGVATDITDGSTASPPTGDSFVVHSFGSATSNPTITVKISGLMNPADTEMLEIGFRQAGDEAQKDATVYVTKEADAAVSDLMLSNRDAGGTGSLSFTFMAIQEVKDDDTKVKVTLSDEFTGFNSRKVMVQKMDDDGDYVDVGDVMAGTGNMFYITKADDADDNIMMGDKVKVTISDLTNPDEVGTLRAPVKVKQGSYDTDSSDDAGIQGAELSTTSPGADVRVEISTRAMMEIPGGDDIDVTLSGFGIPDTIDESDVRIEGGSASNVNPSDVSVSGSKVTISLPTTDARDMDYNIPAETDYSIIFKQGAGLTNPTSGGTKDITVSDMDDDNHEMTVTIKSSVSVKPSFVNRGDDATVTAKGLEDGTATVHLQEGRARSDSDMVLGSGTAEDGVVEIVIDTSDLERGAMRDGDKDKGDNTLYVKDASNEFVGETTIGIKPTIKLDSDSVKRSGKLEITVSDWYYGANATVTIGGESAGSHTIDGHKDTIEVTVPADVRFGKQEVKVSGSNPRGLKTFSVTAEVTIDALSINISPSTVVPGAQVTITGSGYVKDTEVQKIMIGDKEADLPYERDDREATSAGRIAYTITVPLDVGSGEKDVQVTVGTRADERVGVGEITVPKPSIELDPATSVPGSVISVNGSGFASSGRVEVRYKDAIEEVGRADSSGDFHIRLEIPSDAGVGKKNEVKVEVRGTTSINAKAEHKTPGSAIMVPETAQVGTLITLSGTNFEPFSNLDVRIGGRDATPSPGPETDKNGAFEFEARVPRLAAGSHTVTIMDAEDNSVSETFSVVTSPVVSTPEEVFGVLGDKLVSVWGLDNATKAWSAYFPGAPEGVSDLTGVSRGDIVWINVNADVAFQGSMLTTGWNLISLE